MNIASAQPQWQKQNPPTKDDLHDVYFLNDYMGWVYTYGTGQLIHTSNGGKTWQVQAQLDSLYFEQIQFVDKNHGWLCGERGFVYKTKNGGKHWIDVSPAFKERIIESFSWSSKDKPKGWYVLFYAMHFFNTEKGFIAGGKFQPSGKNGTQNMQFLFLQTENGGKSWIQNDQAPATFLYNTFFLNPSLGYASGDRYIYRTTDKGKTWISVYEDESPKKSQIRGLYFLNSQVGFAVSFSGKFIKTTDGAKTWTELKITENQLRGVLFINENNGFIVGDSNKEKGVLHQTSDGGKTWQTVNENYPDLHRIRPSDNKIWIVGKNGTVLVRNKN